MSSIHFKINCGCELTTHVLFRLMQVSAPASRSPVLGAVWIVSLTGTNRVQVLRQHFRRDTAHPLSKSPGASNGKPFL